MPIKPSLRNYKKGIPVISTLWPESPSKKVLIGYSKTLSPYTSETP